MFFTPMIVDVKAANPTISGLVRDAAGNPIPDALIVAQNASTGLEVASTISDASGNYSLSVPIGMYNLAVTPPANSGFSSKTINDVQVASDMNLDIVLAVAPPVSGVLFSGRIVDQYGNNPISDTEAIYINDGSISMSGPNTFSVRLDPGHYDFKFECSDWWGTAWVFHTSIDLQQDTNVTYTLQKRVLTGKVLDPQGNPQSGVKITASGSFAFDGLNGTFTSCPKDYPGISDTEGNFVLSVFACNNVQITANPPPESSYGTVIVSGIDVTEDTNVVITLTAPASGFILNGRIVDQYGNNPISDTEAIYINDAASWMCGPNTFSVRLNPGLYDFKFECSDWWGRAWIIYTSIDLQQDTNVTYVMHTRVLSGKVLDPQGNSQSGVRISASGISMCNETTFSFSSCPASYPGVTDAQGNFTLTAFECSDVTLTASPPPESPYGTVTVSNIDLTDNTSVVVTLSAPVSGFLLNVQFVDQYGNSPFDPNYEALFVNNSAAWVSEPNEFSVRLNPGHYTFMIYVSSWWGTALDARTSIDLQQDTNVTYTLQTHVLNSKVLDPQGNPQSGVRIAASGNIAFDGLNGTFTSCPKDYPGISDTEGNFVLSVFACNNVTLTVSPPPESPYGTVTITNINLTEDKTVIIALVYKPVLVAFAEAGVGSDFIGPVVTIDGTNYSVSNLSSATFWWDVGSSHTFAFQSPLTVNANQKQYVLIGASASSPYTVSGPATIAGTYKTQYFVSLAVSPSGSGSISPAGTGLWEDAGSLSISVTPILGYAFLQWSSSTTTITFLDPLSSSTTATIGGSGTITANLVIVPRTYTVTFTESGLPSQTRWSVTFNGAKRSSKSSMIVFNGIPAGIYQWSGETPISGGTGTQYVASQSSGSMTVPVQTKQGITFKTQYYLTMSANFGTTSPSSGWFNSGSTVTISASSPSTVVGERYVWRLWISNGLGSYSGTSNPASNAVNMQGPVSEYATWDHQYLLTVKTNGMPSPYSTQVYFGGSNVGAVSDASPLTSWITAGAATGTVGVDAQVADGLGTRYVFTSWSDGITANPRSSIRMNSPITLTANYQTQYPITFTETGLPTGTRWSVTLDNQPKDTTGTSITFQKFAGTYSYTVGNAIGSWTSSTTTSFAPVPPDGSVTVSTSSVLQKIKFYAPRSSSYWAGYMVVSSLPNPTSTVTMVSGSWIVQSIDAALYSTSAQWIGIGGAEDWKFNNIPDQTLIQVGTYSRSRGYLLIDYFAWYELLPDNPTVVPLPAGYHVYAGDRMQAEISLQNSATNRWSVTINDLTQNWHWSRFFTFRSSMYTAEWIEEHPKNTGGSSLANFHTAYFGPDYTSFTGMNWATVNGNTAVIGSQTYVAKITMMNTARTQVLAQPSALTQDGTSFTVTWVRGSSSAGIQKPAGTLSYAISNAGQTESREFIVLLLPILDTRPSQLQVNEAMRDIQA
jgi:hypothetical protein